MGGDPCFGFPPKLYRGMDFFFFFLQTSSEVISPLLGGEKNLREAGEGGGEGVRR